MPQIVEERNTANKVRLVALRMNALLEAKDQSELLRGIRVLQADLLKATPFCLSCMQRCRPRDKVQCAICAAAKKKILTMDQGLKDAAVELEGKTDA